MSLDGNVAVSGDLNRKMLNLVNQIQQGNSERMVDLWKCVDRLCQWYCRRIYRQMPARYMLEYEDLYNCGYIALCDAVTNCDPSADTKFSFYYLFYLTSAIYRENSLPRGRRSKDGEKYHDPIISQGRTSIDSPINDNAEKPQTLQELLCAPCKEGEDINISDAINRIYLQQLHDALEVLIQQLPAEEQYFVRRKYFDDVNRKCIAAELGITPHQIVRIEDKAMLHLREKGNTVGLEQFINSHINYYAGTGLTRFKEAGSSVEKLAERRMELETRYQKLFGGKNSIIKNAHSAQ